MRNIHFYRKSRQNKPKSSVELIIIVFWGDNLPNFV